MRSSIAARLWRCRLRRCRRRRPSKPGEAGITIDAPDLNQTVSLDRASPASPLAAIVRLTLGHLQLQPDTLRLKITINSTMPIASGLGSGAAVSTAIVRALAQWAQVTVGHRDRQCSGL